MAANFQDGGNKSFLERLRAAQGERSALTERARIATKGGDVEEEDEE